MATVELDCVSKRYSDRSWAVDGISLNVEDRELLVLVGPSGCGKSTTLRLIAGLEQSDAGEIRIDGRRVNEVPARDRDLAMVFQNYALYPHMSVYKNLAFGLELRFGGGVCARVLRRIFRPQQAAELAVLRRGVSQRVQQAARRLGIEHLLSRRPHELSGGERQRVAVGRAIVRNPAAFLFDEPLSNLDAQLRTDMRGEIRRLQQELQATMLYVTHDQVEALTLGDRIAVLNRGRIEQIGPPQEVYLQPANRFVAEFLGATPMNFLVGRLERVARREGANEADEIWFREQRGNWSIKLPADLDLPAAGIDQPLTLGIRPEHVRLRAWSEGMPGSPARIVQSDWLGDAGISQVELGNESAGAVRVVARTLSSERWTRGQWVAVDLDSERIVWLDPRRGVNLRRK